MRAVALLVGDLLRLAPRQPSTDNVQGQPRGQHERRLGVPKVVHDGDECEEDVVSDASQQRAGVEHEVAPALGERLREGVREPQEGDNDVSCFG